MYMLYLSCNVKKNRTQFVNFAEKSRKKNSSNHFRESPLSCQCYTVIASIIVRGFRGNFHTFQFNTKLAKITP